jgi:hypothetical protein
MALVFGFLGFLIMFAIALMIFVSAINYYVKDSHKVSTKLVLRILLSLSIHIILSATILSYFGLLMIIEAHTEGYNLILSLREKLLYSFLLLIYLICGWLLASFAGGKLITFRSIWERCKV